jgi:hypothetical protein
LENVANISISNLRSDLNIFKQCLMQQNYDMDILTNDLQSKFDVQTSHINQLVRVNQILNFNFNVYIKVLISSFSLLVYIFTLVC